MRVSLTYIAFALAPFALIAACSAGSESTDETTTTGPTTGVGGTSNPMAATTTTTGPGTGGSGATGAAGGNGGGGGNGGAGGSATVVLHETFNDDSGFSKVDTGGSPITFFANGNNDYFGISDGNNGGDFGGDTVPNGIASFMGFAASFLTAEDLDGDGGPNTVRLEWTGLNVAGLTGLTFAADFAASGTPDANEDFINVEFQIDGGGYTKLIEFIGTTANGSFAEDLGLDGSADGNVLVSTAATFTKPLLTTGDSLDLRLTIRADDDNENVGIDNVRINGL